MKKGEEMNVTRQTLRDMILAELGAVDEDAVVTRTSARGVPSQDLASMSTEDIEGILRQKAGGLSSKMAEFISAMVDAGWDRDQFIRNLAGMDDDILVTLLAPAMRESYDRAVQLLAEAIGTPGPAVDGDDGTLMTVGQFRRLVREALDYDPAYRRIAERLLGAGLPDDAFVPIMGLYQDTGAADASGFEEWLSDEGDRMSDTFKETFNRRPQDVSKLYIAYVTDYSRSGWDERLSGMREWLETVDPDSTDLGTDSLVVTGARLRGPMDESVLMTVGQFRDMVKEAMEAGIFGNIEKHDTGVNKDDTSRISWGVNLDTKYEGGSKYDVNTFSEYIGNKYGGVNGALDNQRLRRIKQAARAAGMVPEYVDMETNTEINPPPSGPPRDVAVEAIKAEIDKYINKKEPGKELENPNIDIPNIDIDAHNIFTHWKYFGVPTDYLDPNDVEGAWQSYTTNESVLMTAGQFRRLVREAAGGSSDSDVKMHLIDLRSMGYSAGDILDGLRDMVYYDEDLKKLDNWLEGQALVPEWPVLQNWLDHLGPEEAEDNLSMLLKAIRPPADPHPVDDGTVKGDYKLGQSKMGGAVSAGQSQGGQATAGATRGNQQALAAQSESVTRTMCKSIPPSVTMVPVGEGTTDDDIDEDCVNFWTEGDKASVDEGPMSDAVSGAVDRIRKAMGKDLTDAELELIKMKLDKLLKDLEEKK